MRKIFLIGLAIILSCYLASAISIAEAVISGGIVFSILAVVAFFLYLSTLTEQFSFKLFFLGIASISLIASILISVLILNEYFSEFAELLSSYSAFLYVTLVVLLIMFLFLLVKLTKDALDAFKTRRGLKE